MDLRNDSMPEEGEKQPATGRRFSSAIGSILRRGAFNQDELYDIDDDEAKDDADQEQRGRGQRRQSGGGINKMLQRKICITDLEYYVTTAIELNNVACELYERGEYAVSTDLFKDAMKAVKDSACSSKRQKQELSSADSRRDVAQKINDAKEKIESIDASEPSKDCSLLDFYDSPSSCCDHGPEWLLGSLQQNLDATRDELGSNENPQEVVIDEGMNIGAMVVFNMGLILIKLKDYNNAENYFAIAIEMLSEEPEDNQGRLSMFSALYNNIGCIQYHRKMFDEALESFYHAYLQCQSRRNSIEDIFQDTNEKEEPLRKANIHMAAISSNLGRLHFVQCQLSEAFNFCKIALDARRKALGDHVDTEATYYNLGLIYQKQGIDDEALECYCHFLEYVESLKTNRVVPSQDILSVLLNVLLLRCKTNEFKTSNDEIEHLTKKLQLLRFENGYESQDIAVTLHRVGDLISENKQYQYAMFVYNEQLRVEEVIWKKITKE